MARVFKTSIKPVTLTSDPAGTEGDVYYNTSLKALRYHDGTTWQTVGSGSSSSQIQVLDTPPNSPSLGTLYFDTQERTFKGYNGIIWYDVAGPKELLDHDHYTNGYVRNVDYGNYTYNEDLVSMDGGTAFTNFGVSPNNDIIDGGTAYGN